MVRVIIVYILALFAFVHSQRSNEAIDTGYLESVLDAAECDRQLEVIRSNVLLGVQFADAGIRIPKGILQGGTVDLGNYHQCLAIEQSSNGMDIRGKYCAIEVPVNQNIIIPSFENPDNLWRYDSSYLNKTSLSKIEDYYLMRAEIQALSGDFNALEEYYGRINLDNPLLGTGFIFGLCVPKPCTIHQAITTLVYNVTQLGFEYTDLFCRLPGDKPWSGADIAAVVIFSVIGLITLLSTCYDVFHKFVLKSDAKAVNSVYKSFSLYTNSKRLTTFTSAPGTLQCMDGIRAIAMMWVIVGHTFSTEPFIYNPLDAFLWLVSPNSLWITTGLMTVDTFFALSGILLVYTTAGKMNGKKLLKNLHWFYLSRMARIMPLLAATVLLEASFFNHMADGPFWETVALGTNRCREYWWYTLLNVQNLFAKGLMCTGHSWYIAIDVQLYFVSPLVLFWVLPGRKRNAWLALVGSFGIVLIASSVYNFISNFPAGVLVPTRGEDSLDYTTNYYINPLTRAAPYFVGLIFGYMLHLCRGKKVVMPAIMAFLLWIWAFGILAGIIYFNYRILQMDWDNQFMDNFMNSFMRPAWACVIGWIIFACTHGYGGPINWVLSLDVWRLPSRLSYGMYLLHYPFMVTINSTTLAPIFFSVGGFTFKFLSYFTLAFVASFIITVWIDSPISALYKQLMMSLQPKKEPKEDIEPDKYDNVTTVENLNIESKSASGLDEIRHRSVPVLTIE